MLLSLHIENVAVIKSVDIDFGEGFTALTGETGAGKSIIIDSINLLLGSKADKSLIRKGERSAEVSGLFGAVSDEIRCTAEELGIPVGEDGALLIVRSVGEDGRSTAKINGRSVSLAVLRSVTESLVAIHGQSDTNELSNPEKHIELLDVYSENEELLNQYREVYSRLEDVRRQISDIREKESERERLKEILEYQIKDIDSVNPKAGEEESLIDDKNRIRNLEKITKNSEFAFKALRGSEKGSASFLISRSISALSQLSDVIPEYGNYSERLEDALSQVNDIAEEIYAVLEDTESDPTESLNKIESRLDKLAKLRRKYGPTLDDVIAFRDKAKSELDTLENFEGVLSGLLRDEARIYSEALAIANTIHTRRVKASCELEAKVKETLEFLDMPKVVFYASIEEEVREDRKVLNRFGSDFVEFYISANLGADAQPISRIASGGELARIMLALKSVIADKDNISTVIFDEIDAGVSGKTARKIGIKMCSLSVGAQLICVTHSAQIASLSDVHLLISKSDSTGVTKTEVAPLDRDGRIAELSRILGGINVTEAQRAAAIDMLDKREN